MTKLIFSARQNVLETLYRALREPLGLKISFEGVAVKTARQWFYTEMRRRAPEFDGLVLVNMDDQLWIVKDAPSPGRTDPSHPLPNEG